MVAPMPSKSPVFLATMVILGLAIRGFKPAFDAGIGASRPVILRQNIRINQEAAHPRSTGRG